MPIAHVLPEGGRESESCDAYDTAPISFLNTLLQTLNLSSKATDHIAFLHICQIQMRP